MQFDILRSGEIKIRLDDGLKYGTVEELRNHIFSELAKNDLSIESDRYYTLYNGRVVSGDQNPFDSTQTVDSNGKSVTLVPRVLGGKGGFGSMLRAIGAQIEKTTNRDACRDLSGRRLRDINEEQRLKKWFAKQAERETERKEAKKRKLEKLKQVADGPGLPKIDDQEFLQKKEDIEESVYEAVDAAFSQESSRSSDALTGDSDSSESFKCKEAEKDCSDGVKLDSGGASASCTQSCSGTSSSKQETNPSRPVKKSLMFDEDLYSSNDSDSDEEEIPNKIAKTSN